MADSAEDPAADDPFADPSASKAALCDVVSAGIFALWFGNTVDKLCLGEGAAEAHDARVILDMAKRELVAEEQALIQMRYWEDRTWPDIAAALATTEDAVKSRHQRILAKLRDKVLPPRSA